MSFLDTRDGRLLADHLLSIGAVRHEAQPDPSQPPLSFNLGTPGGLKPGPLDERRLKTVAEGFAELLGGLDLPFDAVCGIPNAGEPIALALLHRYLRRLVQLTGDDEAKVSRIVTKYGLCAGARVLLIDDMIRDGATKLAAIRVLRASGLVVEHLLVIVDRQQNGAARVADVGVATHELFAVRPLFDYYRSAGKVGLISLTN